MRIDVKISDAVLQWIIHSIRLDSLPMEIADNLVKWASGEKTPTFNQVEKASRATGIPLGYFFLQIPPEEKIPLMEYRTVNSFSIDRPSRNLIDTIHDMEMIQSWTRDHLISEGIQPPQCVSLISENNDIFSCATKIRELLDLPIDWFTKCKAADDSFRFIRRAISNIGVLVMMNGVVGNNTHRVLDIDEFRAFAIIDQYAPLVFINANDSTNGRLFSLIHEFAHICLGENDFFNDRQSSVCPVSAIETLCNAIAGEILVPLNIFLDLWESEIEKNSAEDVIVNLARVFRCGTIVIARKALDNRKIGGELYHKIAARAITAYRENKKRKKDSQGDFYKTAASRIDQRFFRMLIRSVSEGKTLYSDAFRLTNTNRSTYTRLVQDRMGGV